MEAFISTAVQNMIRIGNKRAAAFYEARVPEGYYIPHEQDSVSALERWIRDKYEEQRFVPKDGEWPDVSSDDESDTPKRKV